MSNKKPTQEQVDEIRSLYQGYEQRTQDLWEEMVWEFSMKHGLDDDVAEAWFQEYI